jgi:hypothetical protein
MATDIYGRTGNDFGGSFAADAAKIVFTGGSAGDLVGTGGGVGLLTQQLQVGYTQQVSRIYEVGSNFTFLIMGRSQGQFSVGRVLGPRPLQLAFYSKYGNVCNAATNLLSLQLATGCSDAPGAAGGLASIAYLIRNAVLISVSLTVAAADMIVNEALQGMFVSLDFSG